MDAYRDSYIKKLWSLSIPALKSMVIDIRAQVDIGLMDRKEAHDKINCLSAVLMHKQLEERDGGECGAKI